MEGYGNNMNFTNTDSETINMFFSCKKLQDKDTFSKSDPFLKVFSLENNSKKLIGMTEVIKDNLNPDFETSIKAEYYFEKTQKYVAEIYDCDDFKKMKGDFLGEAFFTLGDVLGSQYNMKVFDVKVKGKSKGKLIVRVEQENDLQKFELDFKINFENIPASGMFSSKKRFYEIRKQRVTRDARNLLVQNDVQFESLDNKEWQLVFRSNPMEGNSFDHWIKRMKSSKMCDNDFNLPLQIILMKYKSNGSHYPIATREVTLSELSGTNNSFEMKNTKKFANKSSPSFSIESFKKKELIDFTDYLKGGLNLIQFMGIDFTLSNKAPHDKNSLHYFSPGNLNQYQRAILALGEILEKYNTSRIIPCYGFGAVLPNGQTSYDFPLNLNFENPYLMNYGQVFECYQSALTQIHFSGPTNFAPLLRAIIAYTQNNMNVNIYNYTIFTILTDGAITDMNDTVVEIVRASSLPLSIIIIGKKRYSLTKRDRKC